MSNQELETAFAQPKKIPSWVDQVDCLLENVSTFLGPLPYDLTPDRLYAASDLYKGFSSKAGSFEATVDQKIYERAQKAGQPPVSPVEELAQRLHDHGMSLALDNFCQDTDLVGVMGGHALVRGSAGYRQAVQLGRSITKQGFCAVTGGGPGAMEATNLGAVTAAMPQDEVDQLVDRLEASATFDNDVDNFIAESLAVAAQITNPSDNLSVPTWFYGHEPSNPFATHIAKYFSNSEREDGLLAIAKAGIVFLAGGPGTMQEVFQDAAQNAYETFGASSPMVFLDPPDQPAYWEKTGALTLLDTTFTNYDGKRRPGWDLLKNVTTVDAAVTSVKTSNLSAEQPSARSRTAFQSSATQGS